MRRSWNRVLQSALSGLLVGLLASGPALAQQPAVSLLPRVLPSAAEPKLTVLVVPLDAAAQAQLPRLTYQAEQAVAGAGRFELVRLADALDAQGAREREARAAEAAAAFQEGQKAYDELDTQKALQQFDKAAQLYEGSDLSRYFLEMSRARVMKIAAYVANGDNKAFQRELKEVLARNPRAEFSANFFPPDELALVEKTRRGILTEATRTLEVKTGEVSAQIFVDGQFQGASPVTLSGLTPSEHFVTAIAPGFAQAQGRFRGEAALTLQSLPSESLLKEWVDRISSAPEGKDRDSALRELGIFAGTQQVLAVLVRGTPSAGAQDAIAIRLDVTDGHNQAYAAGPLPPGDTALQVLLDAVLKTDTPRGKDGRPVKHSATEGPSSGRRTAGYVLLATGVALVAGGVYFGLEASSKADEFKKLPQTDSRAEKLRSDGKTYALIADVGMIAGVVSAGAGTWLAFLGGEGGDGASKPSKARAAPPPSPPRQETAPAPRPEEKSSTPPAPGKSQGTPAPAPSAGKPEDKPAAAPPAADKPAPAPAAPQGKLSRAEEERLKREEEKRKKEEERLKREEEERLKREEEKRKKEEERLKREGGEKRKQEEERLKREQEEKRKQEEERLKREQEEKKKREEEAKRKREEEEKRKREEEEKKKRPPLDEDDLRNY